MLLIRCPWCDERAQLEFTYGGDAAARPADPQGQYDRSWFDYLYLRDNPRGLHRELWQHTAGCRQWFVVERDTATHAIARTEPVAAPARDQIA